MLIWGRLNWLARIVLVCLIGPSLYLCWLPYVPRLKTQNPQTTSLIHRRIRQAQKKGRELKPKRVWVNLGSISPNLVHAVLLAEDDTFYQHSGFDFDQIKIAFQINWQRKKFAYGGSTLTQQLARTLYLSPSKNILRKLKEAIITVWLETVLTKRRILELYLNCVEWGDGIFGIEAAARHYYGKSASVLSTEESVALASILPSPRKWSPLRETPFMRRRRANLISRMPQIKAPETSAVSISSISMGNNKLPPQTNNQSFVNEIESGPADDEEGSPESP